MSKKENGKDLERLADSLASDFTAVRPLSSPLLRLLPWLALTLFYAVGATFVLVPRDDLSEKLTQMPFLFELALVALMGVTAAKAALLASVPDMHGKEWFPAVPLTFFATFVLWLGIEAGMEMHAGELHAPAHIWHHCFSDSLIVALIPVAALVMLGRQGACVRPFLNAMLSVLAAGAAGWIVLRLACEADGMSHLLLYHFLPFICVGVVLGLFARRMFRW